MKKKLLSLALVALMAIGVMATFAACDNGGPANGSATAYGVVHSHYVGKIDVTVADGKVSAMSIDEVQMPYNWAELAVDDDGYVHEPTGLTFAADSADIQVIGSKAVIKKIKIANEVLTLTNTARTGPAVYVVGNYSNAKIAGSYGIETYVAVESNAKWYWDAMAAGNYDILKNSDGTSLTASLTGDAAAWKAVYAGTNKASVTKGNRWLKSVNGYWAATEPTGESTSFVLGWTGNVQATIDALIGKDLNTLPVIYKSTTIREGHATSTVWNIDGDTGATWTDMADYLAVAQLAFNKVGK